jgi:hypothetical protein
MIWALLFGCTDPAPVSAPPDPCEAAWSEASAVRDAVTSLGTATSSPSKDDFLAACALLPADARPCMAPSWQLEHHDDCRKSLDAVPRSVRDRVDARLDARTKLQ